MSKFPLPLPFEGKSDRQEVAHLLRLAKRWLSQGMGELGASDYICHAIALAATSGEYRGITEYLTDYNPNLNAAREAINMIEDRLHGPTYRQYMDRRDAFTYTIAEVQAERHAWLDQLIEEFSK